MTEMTERPTTECEDRIELLETFVQALHQWHSVKARCEALFEQHRHPPIPSDEHQLKQAREILENLRPRVQRVAKDAGAISETNPLLRMGDPMFAARDADPILGVLTKAIHFYKENGDFRASEDEPTMDLAERREAHHRPARPARPPRHGHRHQGQELQDEKEGTNREDDRGPDHHRRLAQERAEGVGINPLGGSVSDRRSGSVSERRQRVAGPTET